MKAKHFADLPCDNITSGDVDGDGLHDLLCGDLTDYTTGKGKAWLVYGSDNLPSVIDFGSSSIFQTAKIITFSGDHVGAGAGSSVSMKDIDGDGLADLTIGAFVDSTSFEAAGATYFISATKIKAGWDGTNPLIQLSSGSDVVLDGDVYELGGTAVFGDVPFAGLPSFGLGGRSGTHRGILLGSETYGAKSNGRIFYVTDTQINDASGEGIMAGKAIQTVEGFSGNNLGTNITSS